MPRTPIDYSKTIIYKLVHNEDYDNANIYIGSTTGFVKRKNQHKNSCNNEKQKGYNDRKYQHIRNNGGWDCFNMIEVEKFSCNDKREAEAREEYWRCHFNSLLNTRKAFTTDEQKKEQLKEYRKQITCECGCMIRRSDISKHRKTQKHLLLTKQIKYEFVDDNEKN